MRLENEGKKVEEDSKSHSRKIRLRADTVGDGGKERNFLQQGCCSCSTLNCMLGQMQLKLMLFFFFKIKCAKNDYINAKVHVCFASFSASLFNMKAPHTYYMYVLYVHSSFKYFSNLLCCVRVRLWVRTPPPLSISRASHTPRMLHARYKPLYCSSTVRESLCRMR